MNCIRCGNEMNDNDKCCYKCGAINPYIEENMSYLKRNHINPNKLSKNNDNSLLFSILRAFLIIIFIIIVVFVIYSFISK